MPGSTGGTAGTLALGPSPGLPTEDLGSQTRDQRMYWRLQHVQRILDFSSPASKSDLRFKLNEYFEKVLEPELDSGKASESSRSNGTSTAPDIWWEGSDGFWYVYLFKERATYRKDKDGSLYPEDVEFIGTVQFQ